MGKDRLDGDQVRAKALDDVRQVALELEQPIGNGRGRGAGVALGIRGVGAEPDHAGLQDRGDGREVGGLAGFERGIAGESQAGIDAEDSHGPQRMEANGAGPLARPVQVDESAEVAVQHPAEKMVR